MTIVASLYMVVLNLLHRGVVYCSTMIYTDTSPHNDVRHMTVHICMLEMEEDQAVRNDVPVPYTCA